MQSKRVSWVDTIKGICIVSVVAMWVDGFLDLRSGWLHDYVVFSRPFRMPDFFLVSGLFLDKVIDKPWKTYLDRKVIHYLYFVLLWSFFTLLLRDWAFDRPDFLSAIGQYAYFVGQPFTSLWFITMLPIYFVLTRLIHRLPWYLVLFSATALFVFRLDTGIRLLDNFGKFYIFFLLGYFFSRQVFKTADWLFHRPATAIAFLVAWAGANSWVTKLFWFTWEEHLIVLLFAGLAGVLALIALSRLIAAPPGSPGYRISGKTP
jgi:uncharacterized membrane protein YcfT